ncbi:Mediator of RNA polymerase II transcription subunit 25 [Desmophyllum pertusum]|uniref:Mediator of RNA polymerase II transcription subunit 25 n=1 Tax=Desmophyllum pertusum TaxID=174260 RepID=A0A9W9ZW67_9CNID|nr:Mediator of RNA polymerase II transcription subunit 25 [Desmophyllum pertusum]
MSKDYSKDPYHLVCIQGLDLPVTRSNDSQVEVSKNGAHIADTNMKSVPAPCQMTASVKESPESKPKKPKVGARQTLPETKLPQPATTTPNMPLTQIPTPVNMILNPQSTPAAGLINNSSAAQQKAQEFLDFAMRQTGRNPTPNSGQPQPMLDVVNVAAANWPQTVTNPATPRAVPPPVAAPQAVSSENPQVAQAQRAIAWTGHLEWQDTIRDPNGPQQRVTRSLSCHVSVVPGDTLKANNWPPKLIMQLIPQNLLSTLGPLLQNSKTVAFHFAPNDQESLRALYRVMASNGIKFAGCVHFPPAPQCDVKVLLLIFSPKKRAFVGLIPVEQTNFVDGIRTVVQKHKMEQVAKITLHRQRLILQQQQQLRQQQQQQQSQQPQNFAGAGLTQGQVCPLILVLGFSKVT